jgi:glycosyltransferase involved in cell wall biosynthesis
MKILFYCPFRFDSSSYNNQFLGGIETLNRDLSINLAKKKGYKVYLATLCKKIQTHKNFVNLPISLLNKKDEYQNFDFIISSNDPTIFNKFKKSKKILWMHNKLTIEKALRKKKLFSILRNDISTVFVSKYLKNITTDLFFFKNKIIIPNFLSNIFNQNKLIYKRKPIFVWSVQRQKGLNESIDMWIKYINPINKFAKFYIFGIDKMDNRFSKSYLLSNNIHFFGKVPKKKLINVYNQSTAMICLGYDETFCLNALEANSCGLTVLSFGKTALDELIINNFNGFRIKTYQELAKRIHFLINSKNKEKTKLIKNSIKFSSKFTLNKILPYWLKLLK